MTQAPTLPDAVRAILSLRDRMWDARTADSPEARSARAYNSALADVRQLLSGVPLNASATIGVTARSLAALSTWIDNAQKDRDPEAVTWGRISKITEEAGEVIAAMIGVTGQNPRKGVTHARYDVLDELLDVAVTALAAVEHMTDKNAASSMDLLEAKVALVARRAGVGS